MSMLHMPRTYCFDNANLGNVRLFELIL